CVTPGEFAPGGVDGELWLSAKTVPTAAPAARAAPTLIRSDRVWCCLAGAMATPAGLAAAPPAVGKRSAAAAPTGSPVCCCRLGCGPSGMPVCGVAALGCCCCDVPEASG